jgi:hypothetical protein
MCAFLCKLLKPAVVYFRRAVLIHRIENEMISNTRSIAMSETGRSGGFGDSGITWMPVRHDSALFFLLRGWTCPKSQRMYIQLASKGTLTYVWDVYLVVFDCDDLLHCCCITDYHHEVFAAHAKQVVHHDNMKSETSSQVAHALSDSCCYRRRSRPS